MAETYEANRSICKYVHSTSRGHEAIQLATAYQLQPQDYVSPYYRDESIVMGIGFTPYEQMLQLLAKRNDIFTGGREYYSHPNYRGDDKPTMIHQSSATGMQVIPTTGVAQGIQYLEKYYPVNAACIAAKSTRSISPLLSESKQSHGVEPDVAPGPNRQFTNSARSALSTSPSTS